MIQWNHRAKQGRSLSIHTSVNKVRTMGANVVTFYKLPINVELVNQVHLNQLEESLQRNGSVVLRIDPTLLKEAFRYFILYNKKPRENLRLFLSLGKNSDLPRIQKFLKPTSLLTTLQLNFIPVDISSILYFVKMILFCENIKCLILKLMKNI